MDIKVRSLGLGTGLMSITVDQMNDETINVREAKKVAMELLDAAYDVFAAADFGDQQDMVGNLLNRLSDIENQ